MLEITINKEKCTGCGDCVNSCPPEILYLDNDAAAVKSEIILGNSIPTCLPNSQAVYRFRS